MEGITKTINGIIIELVNIKFSNVNILRHKINNKKSFNLYRSNVNRSYRHATSWGGGEVSPALNQNALILYQYFGSTTIIQGPRRRELPRKCCFTASRNVKMQKSLPSSKDMEATFCTFQPPENPEIAKNLVR